MITTSSDQDHVMLTAGFLESQYLILLLFLRVLTRDYHIGIRMISALAWVPRGVAKEVPETTQLTQTELEKVAAEIGELFFTVFSLYYSEHCAIINHLDLSTACSSLWLFWSLFVCKSCAQSHCFAHCLISLCLQSASG